MELTPQVRFMARCVAGAAAKRSSLEFDDVEQECLMLAWQAKDETEPALLRCAMNRQAGMMMRASVAKSRVKCVPNETLDSHHVAGQEADVIAEDFAAAFEATLTPMMQETCEAIRNAPNLLAAAVECGISHDAMRYRSVEIVKSLKKFIGD